MDLFFAGSQFSKLVEQSQSSFDEPAGFAQAAAVSCAALAQERLYPLFLSALRWTPPQNGTTTSR
jgi:hypothetical protein